MPQLDVYYLWNQVAAIAAVMGYGLFLGYECLLPVQLSNLLARVYVTVL